MNLDVVLSNGHMPLGILDEDLLEAREDGNDGAPHDEIPAEREPAEHSEEATVGLMEAGSDAISATIEGDF